MQLNHDICLFEEHFPSESNVKWKVEWRGVNPEGIIFFASRRQAVDKPVAAAVVNEKAETMTKKKMCNESK